MCKEKEDFFSFICSLWVLSLIVMAALLKHVKSKLSWHRESSGLVLSSRYQRCEVQWRVGWHCYLGVGVLACVKLFLAVLFKNWEGEVEGAMWKRGNASAKEKVENMAVVRWRSSLRLENGVCSFNAESKRENRWKWWKRGNKHQINVANKLNIISFIFK